MKSVEKRGSMRKGLFAAIFAMVIAGAAISGPVHAHEFILKPVLLNASTGQPLPFSVLSAHVYMVSEEVEPVEQVEASLIRGDAVSEIPLEPNDILLTLDGRANIEQEGTSILCGHRKGMIWTKTTQGWKQASKKGLSGVISSGKYEKFCKTLITAGQADDGFKRVVGHRLEIVPVDNPGAARVGDELSFQVLFDGKPLAAEVRATYDGFTTNPNTYAYVTETEENGVARVKLTHPGAWMVRVQHTIDDSTPDYDKCVLRAVLVFGVN